MSPRIFFGAAYESGCDLGRSVGFSDTGPNYICGTEHRGVGNCSGLAHNCNFWIGFHAGGGLALHAPCTLQHGQRLRGGIEHHLRALGFDVQSPASESHLCCGSAGTYSILQSDLANQLRDRKLKNLGQLDAQCIISANIGCIQHLKSGTSTPVKHWIEVLDAALGGSAKRL